MKKKKKNIKALLAFPSYTDVENWWNTSMQYILSKLMHIPIFEMILSVCSFHESKVI
jgi:hypothetical protein